MQKRPLITFIPQILSSRSPFRAEIGNLFLHSYNDSFSQEFHDCTEFVYCQSGNGSLRYEDFTFDFQAGDVVYLSPYMPHYIYKTGTKPCRCEFIHVNLRKMFDPEIFKDLIAFTDKLLVPFSIPPILSQKEYPQISELISMLLEEMNKYPPYLSLSVQGYCMCITSELRKIWEQNKNQHNLSSYDYLYQAAIYMSQHYNENISIAQLAQICNISETHFRRLFKKNFSISPLKYLNLIRIRESCVLLSRKPFQISEIAEMTGFQTLSSFNRQFKEIMGESPTKWINHLITTEDTPQVLFYG